MSYWIYSHEALPNPNMLGRPGYTPDASYIKWGGVTLPALPAKTWVELDDDDPRYVTFYRWNWTQKKGNLDYRAVPLKQFMPIVNNPSKDGMGFMERGCVMLNHEPTAAEKKALEQACAENNFLFRKRCVEFYEDQHQLALANKGRYQASVYIDECYDVLGIKKPYSFEALQEQRQPGKEAADRIADAIAGAMKAAKEQALEEATRPGVQFGHVPMPAKAAK